MPSKTPEFDSALDKILDALAPHARTCKQCSADFNIYNEDIEFYKKFRVPPPALCPRCRLQRRMANRLRLRPVFYKKACAAPGHTEKVITFIADDSPVPVYDDAYYRSENWDALSFGVAYDNSQPFFEQFSRFANKVPHQTAHKDSQSVNSDYAIAGSMAKNCYYTGSPVGSENLQFGDRGVACKDCIEFNVINNAENCFFISHSDRSYNCAYCAQVSDCIDSYFLYDCRGCTNCFGCYNLRNKQYCWDNEQLSKEDYEAKLAGIDFGSYQTMKDAPERLNAIIRKAIHRNLDNQKTKNCLGNQNKNANNCYEAYECFNDGDNLRYTVGTLHETDSMDTYGVAGPASLLYEAEGIVGPSSNVKFAILVRGSQDAEYCIECTNIEHCFACFGLKGKKFCIFNTQYTEDEYWPKLDEIKTKMLADGEYGEHFPIAYSPFPYNYSDAQTEFPLPKDEVLPRGWSWRDPVINPVDLRGMEVVNAADLPDNIKDATDDLLHKAVLCIETGRPFRLTPYELEFYRRHNLPLPRLHPDRRIDRILEHKISYRLFDDVCHKCGKEIKSGYDPAMMYNVYCESCYQNEVI